jgi:4-oxalocrotonate tautomerase
LVKTILDGFREEEFSSPERNSFNIYSEKRGVWMMPIIHVEMFAGRTLEQKRAMVKEITEAVVRTVECKPEAVTIFIREMEKQDLAKAGVLYSDAK